MLASIGIVLGILGYLPYFRDMIIGVTTPHIFSWFIWGVLTGIAFFGQLSDGGGAGARVTGVASLFCIIILIFALTHGGKTYIDKSDRYAFIGACVAIGIRWWTHNPLWSIILVTLIDMLGFYPTLRKGRYDPTTETASTT